jgi:hypothetical protein
MAEENAESACWCRIWRSNPTLLATLGSVFIGRIVGT